MTVSVVSHGHGALVVPLLQDLARHSGRAIRVVLTLNVPEALEIDGHAYPFPLRIVRNSAPKGFGANHNAALTGARTPFLCVLNPDVRISADPFATLLEELRNQKVGVAAPKILNPDGSIADSARHFPTVFSLLSRFVKRFLGFTSGQDYAIADAPLSPDWVAGMFMVFRREVFAEVRGFDERYFLYFEDVDLCRRLRERGYDVRFVPAVYVVHEARRQSRRNPRYFLWHLASMFRYFLAH